VYLSREAGWYDVNGNAIYVRANEKFADSDPVVQALPSILDKISDDGPPVKSAVRAAVAAARGKGAVSD
jgi:hypothetical protein